MTRATRIVLVKDRPEGTRRAPPLGADDELRSVNGQLDYLLRKALREAGRLPDRKSQPGNSDEPN